jgi:acetolactate synthase regulatory subunit
VQCGADLDVHRLLQGVRKEMQMKNEVHHSAQSLPKKIPSVGIYFQIIPGILLLICAVWGIFVGLRILTVIDRIVSKPSDVQSLSSINPILEKELDLIVDQHRENQLLQEKLQKLTDQMTLLQSQTPPANKAQGVNP